PNKIRRFHHRRLTMFLSSAGAIRRLVAAAALLAFPLFASVVHVESAYPNKSIKFVVPYAAGGFPDTVARIIAQRLSVTLGRSVIVDKRPGAHGWLSAS